MELNHTARRISVIRKVGWLSVASMLALAMLAPTAAPTFAAATDAQSVNICHGTASNSNPYNAESPSVSANGATEGQLSGGHSNHVGPVWFSGIQVVWGDIIPPYHYAATNYDFPGLNWTTAGQAIFNNGCNIPSTTTTTTTTSTTTTGTSTTSTTTTSTTSTGTTTTGTTTTGTTTTGATTTGATTTTPSQGILAETDVPVVTLPPTDGMSGSTAPLSDSWRMLLIVAAALLASLMVMAPTKVASRRR